MPEGNGQEPARDGRGFWGFLRRVFSAVFGRISWKPPGWMSDFRSRVSEPTGRAVREAGKKAGGWARAHPKVIRFGAAGLVLLVVGGLGVYSWWSKRPKPIVFSVHGSSPAVTALKEDAKPDVLHVYFSGSAARLQDIEKIVSRGIHMTPEFAGEWKWSNDKELVFTPKSDWPVGQFFTVRFDKELFPDHVRLDRYKHEFESASFGLNIQSFSFYQDPVTPAIKKVVATLAFTHPVDADSLEKRITLKMEGDREDLPKDKKPKYQFTVTYDKFKGEAYVHSEPLSVPPGDVRMILKVEGGVHSSRGGPPEEQSYTESTTVPGMYSYFHINSADLSIARNEKYEPEQVLVVTASVGALESEIQKHISAWLLPKDRPAIGRQKAAKDYYWQGPEEIGKEVLQVSTQLELKPISTDTEYATLHSFKYDAEPGRFVYVRLTKGIESYGGYILANEYSAVRQVPEFPRELEIMHKGALLSLSGDKTLSVLSRDVEAVRFTLGQVLPDQINHLITQSGGTFASPYFKNYQFNQQNISESHSELRVLAKLPRGKAQYTGFDFSSYITGHGGSSTNRGLYFFRVEAWDTLHNRPASEEFRQYSYGTEYEGEGDGEGGDEGEGEGGSRYQARGVGGQGSDSRLILITDLGLLVKDSEDNSHDVFVQSIGSGLPVEGAGVEVLGKNGVPIVSQTTGEDGRVHFPSLRDFKEEKTPAVYVARKGSDISFIPYDRRDRTLNFSRFDIGGRQGRGQGSTLQAYLFSDRGIYRPGDTFHVGVIVKDTSWAKTPEGVPLQYTITDPRGREIAKENIKLSAAAFEEIKYDTKETSSTGAYNVNLYLVKEKKQENVPERTVLLGSTTVRVEEFLPDRLHISARFSKGSDRGWVPPKDLSVNVTLHNLFGTPATGRRVTANLTLSPGFASLPGFQEYSFFDPLRAKSSFEERLVDGETDDKGESTFALDLDRYANATYRLSVLTQGYEAEGGRSVQAEASVLVSPLPYLIGYKADGELTYLKKDSEHKVEVIAVGPDAEKIAAADLKAHLVEIRYVSVLTRRKDGTYQYESVRKEVTVSKTNLTIPAGGFKYSVPTGQPGDFALIIRAKDDTELNRVNFTVAGEGNLTRTLDKNAELQIRLNKADFDPGEEIEIQVKAPYTGAGLVTIERDRVFANRWFKSTTTASIQHIRVPEDFEGNGYVVVSFVRAADSQEIYMSPLSYAVAPFSVSRARRTVKINLTAPEIARPGEAFKIKYSTVQPSKIVVFAVDEGILQVARYQTPDPLSYFFQKRALEVTTFQILDLILPEYSIVKTLSSTGGDEYEALSRNLNPFKRKREKPAVYWSGIMNADSTEREVSWTVPDSFNGAVRVMAVAVASDAVGAAEKKSLVKGHFILSPNVPTFVAPGDEFDVSLAVSNNAEGSGSGAQVKVELKTSEHLEVVGPAAHTLPVAEGKEASDSFHVKAKDVLGSANLTFRASLGDKASKYSTDLSVRPPMPFITTIETGHFKDGQVDVAVPRRIYPQFRKLEASASVVPLGLSKGLLNFLQAFPYGCTEQVLSQSFPALLLLAYPEFGFSPEKVQSNLKTAIATLRSRQDESGGFGFWAGNANVDDFLSDYAVHFLTEAKERGYPVPDDLMQSALSYLEQVANKTGRNLQDLRTQAYAVYLLTRNSVVTTRYIESLRKRLDDRAPDQWKKDLSAVYLAASYKLLKQDSEAESLIGGVPFGEKITPDWEYFYDGLVQDSQYLEVLSRYFPRRLEKLSGDAILRLMQPVIEQRYNTLSSSYTIMALASYVQATGRGAPADLLIGELLADGKHKALVPSGGMFPTAAFSDAAAKVRIASSSDLNVYYQVTRAGFETTPPKEVVKKQIEVFREFHAPGGGPVDKAPLGGDLEVHLFIRALPGVRIQNVAVVDLLPGGFEVISEPGLHDGSVPGSDWHTDYVDVREDRVLAFGCVCREANKFVYRVRATNKGTYAIPPTFAEGMYDRTAQARGLGGKIEVVAAQ